MIVNKVVIAQSENQLIKTAKSSYLKEDYKNALEGYRQLLSNDLTNIDYNFKYAVCLFYTKNPKSSEKYFNYLLEQSDCPIAVFYFKGRLYHLNYEFDNAIEMYSKYIRLKTKKSTDFKCVDEIMRCQNAKELLKSPRAIQVVSQEERTASDYFSAYLFDSINFKLYTIDDFNKKVNSKKGFSPKYVFKRGMKYRFFSSYTNDGL
jgi:tetratricopeptide (TPR) repeat protein